MINISIGLKENYQETTLTHRLLHNTRLHKNKSKNEIFKNENVRIFLDKEINKMKTIKEFDNFFKLEKENLENLVKEKTGRKSQIENLILESVINISLSDFEKYRKDKITKVLDEYIKEILEKKYGLKIYSVELHLDEGHIDNDEKEKRNVHCHIIHSSVNLNTGKSFTRELFNEKKVDENGNEIKNKKGEIVKRQDLSKSQDDIYEFMSERLENLQKHKKSKNKHIDYKTYKELKKQEQEKLKKLELENKNLKDTIIKNNNSYKELLNKQNKIIENQNIYITKLQQQIKDLENKLTKTTTQSQQHQIQRKITNLEKHLSSNSSEGFEL